MIVLSEPFKSLWHKKETFHEVRKLEGEVFREVKARRTLRFVVDEKYYFAKIHFGIGWREVFKDLLQFRLPIVSARNEWIAIAKLKQLDLDTMNTVAFGQEGANPAKIRSFIITEELTDTTNLEEYCGDWHRQPPAFTTKLALIKKIAHISRIMHDAGMCHRDYYLCHFHLDPSSLNTNKLKLSLIDLHRALIKKSLAKRWLIKDIAGLYFSSMEIGLSARDRLRFMKLYSGDSLRNCLEDKDDFWACVSSRALKLHAKDKRNEKAER